MTIDAHTHCFPLELGESPASWARQRGEPHWSALVAPEGRKSIQDWTSPRIMRTEMDAAGVDRAVLLGWYWENEATCRWHNERIAEWCADAPDRFIGFAAVLPNENVLDQLEHAAALGLRGVGELHPGVQGFDSSNPNWHTLAQWCTSHRWPVNFHCTRPVGDHPSARPTPLQDYVKMVRDYPALTFIFAHFGAGLAEIFKEHPPVNVYYDCSASPLLYDWTVFAQTMETAGSDRLIFGSDYPLRLYPKQSRHAEMQRFIEDIRTRANLDPCALSGLMGQNFAALDSRQASDPDDTGTPA